MSLAVTLAHFAVRLLIATTLALAAFPAAAHARFFDGRTAPPSPRAFPVAGAWEWGGIDTHFGDRGGAHKGEDVMSDCGTPVVAAAAGRVAFVDSGGASGNYLVVRGDDGDQVYMHLLHEVRLDVGDALRAGQRLGSVGRTGNASACHLHFETWSAPGWYHGGEPHDPRPALRRWAALPPS
ncbi:MAG TPA: M23 family metallopeptidase [Solirubrobacteraceae bacterium]|jgi:murein DD-endopeptidase MepM/ murein hydrolase activator NlpD